MRELLKQQTFCAPSKCQNNWCLFPPRNSSWICVLNSGWKFLKQGNLVADFSVQLSLVELQLRSSLLALCICELKLSVCSVWLKVAFVFVQKMFWWVEKIGPGEPGTKTGMVRFRVDAFWPVLIFQVDVSVLWRSHELEWIQRFARVTGHPGSQAGQGKCGLLCQSFWKETVIRVSWVKLTFVPGTSVNVKFFFQKWFLSCKTFPFRGFGTLAYWSILKCLLRIDCGDDESSMPSQNWADFWILRSGFSANWRDGIVSHTKLFSICRDFALGL